MIDLFLPTFKLLTWLVDCSSLIHGVPQHARYVWGVFCSYQAFAEIGLWVRSFGQLFESVMSLVGEISFEFVLNQEAICVLISSFLFIVWKFLLRLWLTGFNSLLFQIVTLFTNCKYCEYNKEKVTAKTIHKVCRKK